MSFGWSVFVGILVLANIVGCVWLLVANRHVQIDPDAKGNTTGHEYDGIEELHNPMPAWWTWFFVGKIVFSIIYLILYPGMGSFAGTLGWSSSSEVERDLAAAEARYGPIFDAYLAQPIPSLLSDDRAVGMGSRIFANRCSVCHGSDARGGPGYPNLTDDDWLYGGSPEMIVQTITHGRVGQMPPFAAAIGGADGVEKVTEYVLSLSGRDHDRALAAEGQATFAMICGICHGADGMGNPALGAPDLTDNIWLHGGARRDIARALEDGIMSQMPSHKEILTAGRIHLAGLYVYSLSHDPGATSRSPAPAEQGR